MIIILRFLMFSIFWYFTYNKLSKSDFRGIFNNLDTQLGSLSNSKLINFLTDLTKDNQAQNPTLNSIPLPVNFNIASLYDNKYKKLFLFGFGFTLIAHRFLLLFKKIILLPFKLGVFSFLYSILGVDLTWFLNIFNYFTINIPFWVYVQYLTLYNNWLNWWYSTVNIKSITTVPLIEDKKIKNNITKSTNDLNEIDIPKNNKIWYIAGIVTVIIGVGFALWYFDVFNSSEPGPGDRPNPVVERNLNTSRVIDNTESVHSIPDQTRIISDPVALMNSQMDEFNRNNPYASSSNSRNPLINSASSNINRFNVLDELNEFKRPDSPTGSDDSNSTIREFIRPKAVIRALRNIGNNNNG